MRSDGARASVHCGPRQWKQPPGWITAEDREVLPLPPFLPIAFWHKGVGLCGHAAGASRLPGVFAAFVARSSVLERMGWADLAFAPWESSGPRASSPLGQRMGFTEREGRFMDRPPERLYLRGVI